MSEACRLRRDEGYGVRDDEASYARCVTMRSAQLR